MPLPPSAACPRARTPLCPPPLQRRRIALFPDVSRETPRASAPPIRTRARRAALNGEKASNSEEAARLRRPRRAVAKVRLPSTGRYAEEGFPVHPEPGAKLPNSMVSCHGESPLPPPRRHRRGPGGRHPAEKSSGEGATSGPEICDAIGVPTDVAKSLRRKFVMKDSVL